MVALSTPFNYGVFVIGFLMSAFPPFLCPGGDEPVVGGLVKIALPLVTVVLCLVELSVVVCLVNLGFSVAFVIV